MGSCINSLLPNIANVVVQPIASREYKARRGMRRENAQYLKIVQEFEGFEDNCRCCILTTFWIPVGDAKIPGCCPLGTCVSSEKFAAYNESKYTFVMENRVEFNEPSIKLGFCKCRIED